MTDYVILCEAWGARGPTKVRSDYLRVGGELCLFASLRDATNRASELVRLANDGSSTCFYAYSAMERPLNTARTPEWRKI